MNRPTKLLTVADTGYKYEKTDMHQFIIIGTVPPRVTIYYSALLTINSVLVWI